MKVVVAAVLVTLCSSARADNPLGFAGTTAEIYGGFSRLAQPVYTANGGEQHWQGGLIGVDAGARFGRRPYLNLAVLLDVKAGFYHENEVVDPNSVMLRCDANVWAVTGAVEYVPVPFVFARVGVGALLHAADHCKSKVVQGITLDLSDNGALVTDLRAGLRATLGHSMWLEFSVVFDFYGAPSNDTSAHFDDSTSLVLGFRGMLDR